MFDAHKFLYLDTLEWTSWKFHNWLKLKLEQKLVEIAPLERVVFKALEILIFMIRSITYINWNLLFLSEGHLRRASMSVEFYPNVFHNFVFGLIFLPLPNYGHYLLPFICDCKKTSKRNEVIIKNHKRISIYGDHW